MSEKLFYTDPLYLIKIKSIFGYGGYCHDTYLFHVLSIMLGMMLILYVTE